MEVDTTTMEEEMHPGEQGSVHASDPRECTSDPREPSPIAEAEMGPNEQGSVHTSEPREPSPNAEEEMHRGEQGSVHTSEPREPSPIAEEEMHRGEQGSVHTSEPREPSPIAEEKMHPGERGSVYTSGLREASPVVEEEIPTVGMVFNSDEDVHAYYKRYAYREGFGFRRASTKSDNGRVKYYSLACNCSGKFVSVARTSSNLRPSIKTGCKAKINVVVEGSGRCTISCVYLDHNHALSPRKARYQRCPKRMDAYSKTRLDLNDKNLPFEERDCRNYIARARQLRLGEGDAEALCNYFARMQRRNSNFYHMIDMDDDGRVRNVFWADARSRAAYEAFGDVVSFDSTCFTNKYNMPLGAFFGVNHHGQSVLFGCGLLSDEEDTGTYIWLFTSWLQCMNGRPPKAIIIDQCNAIQAAVAEVFPHSHYRLCLRHIMKKIPEKLGRLTEYKSIKRMLEGIAHESLEPNEFDENWSQMIRDYSLERNDWLSSLFQDRSRWVPAYVKKTFWAGMSTTQRSESVNALFDDYVNSKTSLKQFVEQYDNALKSKMEKENKADFESLNSSYPFLTDYYFERQFQDAYTNNIFKLFQDELRGLLYCNSMLYKVDGAVSVFNVSDVLRRNDGDDKKRVAYSVMFNEAECDIQCSCRLFEYKGILCRHMVKILIENDVNEVPSRYILTRWRKDLKHRHYYVKNCYGDSQTSERDMRFDKLCANFIEAADIAANSLETHEALMRFVDEEKCKLKNSDGRGGNTQLNQASELGTDSGKTEIMKRRKRKLQLSGGKQGGMNKKVAVSSSVESEVSLANDSIMDTSSRLQEMQNYHSAANESTGQINFTQPFQILFGESTF